jgi:hypothetical protein
MSPRILVAAVALSLAACEDPPPDEPSFDNHAPIARLVVPQLVVRGDVVAVDAAASSDVDVDAGLDALHFTFRFGDGTPAAESDDDAFDHVFAGVGSFVVGVDVEDDFGGAASVDVDVVVVDGVVEGCSCALPCLGAGLCALTDCVVADASDGDAFVETTPCN